MIPWEASALAPARDPVADEGAIDPAGRPRRRDLVPPGAAADVKRAEISAVEQGRHRCDEMALVIEPRRARLAEGLEVGRINEVRDFDAVDLISEGIILAGITDFVGVKGAGILVGLDEDCQIDVRIAQHF